MVDVISQWLITQLGIVIKHSFQEFAPTTKDGYILSLLLENYDVIEKRELASIEKSSDPEVCRKNFAQIANWLKRINVEINNEEIDDIVNERDMASLNIFYKLYLLLFSKGKVDFICQQELKQRMENVTGRFIVTKDEEKPTLPIISNKYDYPLVEGYDIIHWYRDKLAATLARCNEARKDYETHLAENRKHSLSVDNYQQQKFVFPINKETKENESVPSLDITYDELLDEEMKAKCLKQVTPDPKEAVKILKRIRRKYKTDTMDSYLKSQFHKEVLANFYKKVMEKEHLQHEKILAEKLAKQSLYEKQMVKKMEEVKMQKSIMLENYMMASKEIATMKDEEYLDKLKSSQKQINTAEFMYYLEKQRLLELHTRLYAEKLRLKAEKRHAMCKDIVSDIVDIAIRWSEFTQFYLEEPDDSTIRTWKQLFIAEQKIADFVPALEKLITDTEPSLEEIYVKEIDRQEEVDKQDFKNYLDYEGPWQLEQIKLEQNEIETMRNGMKVLGFIVYRLLDLKYPLPPSPPKPDLPNLEVSVCVTDLHDVSCLPILRRLLAHRDIRVYKIDDAVEYCVAAYKKEVAFEEDTYDVVSIDSKTKEDEGKGMYMLKKKMSKMKKTASIREDEDEEGPVSVRTQTPKYFPNEEITLSRPAELGKIATDELEDGMALTDFLVVSMFVELLKSEKDIRGWVLVNFPTNYEQAVLLEEAMTGVPVPGLTYKMTVSGVSLCSIFDEPNMKSNIYRSSMLVKEPSEKNDSIYYETALTAFISLVHELEENKDKSLYAKWKTAEKDYNRLEHFYSDMGCLYLLFYDTLNFAVIKQLAKLIIGDYTLPPKNSVELFGETVNYLAAEELLSGADQSFSSSSYRVLESVKNENQEKVKKKTVYQKKENINPGKEKAAVVVYADKWTQIPEEEVEVVEVDELQVPPKPGEYGWKYMKLAFPEERALGLTNLWENAEMTYVEDFKQLLFIKRVLMSYVIPYVKFIKDGMKIYLTALDRRQIDLRNFQKTYNDFYNDMRGDVEFKAEQHYQVNQLKMKLIETCQDRMMEAENARMVFIQQNWASSHMIEYLNNMINAFNLEMDRLVDTIYVINDYYFFIIKNSYWSGELQKIKLNRLESDDHKIQIEMNKIFKSSEEKIDTNPLEPKVKEIVVECEQFINNVASVSFDGIKQIQQLRNPMKVATLYKKVHGPSIQILEPSPDVMKNLDALIEEWTAALKGEIQRVKIQVMLLEYNTIQNLWNILSRVKESFYNNMKDIQERYLKELDSSNKACLMFDHAIEAEVPIPEELLFHAGEFCVDPNVLLLANDEKHKKEQVMKVEESFACTLSQMFHFMAILMDIAPDGTIGERPFTYFLQDIISREDRPSIPRAWTKLTGRDVEKLSKILFGNEDVVDWKDFITRNLQIRYPTIEELVIVTRQFKKFTTDMMEMVTKEQFNEVKLWFEDELPKEQTKIIKNLLYILFSVNDYFNYPNMLFSFCKGNTAAEGFAKALSVSAQYPVCLDFDTGEIFRQNVFEERRRLEEEIRKKEEERQELMKDMGNAVYQVVDQIIKRYEEVDIREVTNEEAAARQKGKKFPNTKSTHDQNIILTTSANNETIQSNQKKKLENSPIKLKTTSTIKKETFKTNTPEQSLQEVKQQIFVNPSTHSDESIKLTLSNEDMTSNKANANFTEGNTSKDHQSIIRSSSRPKTLSKVTYDLSNDSSYTSETKTDARETLNLGQKCSIAGEVDSEVESLAMLYLLPLSLIETVLNATLPWYNSVKNIEDKSEAENFLEFYSKLQVQEFNMEIFSHQLLNSPEFIKLISTTPKFVILHPEDVVRELIENKKQCN